MLDAAFGSGGFVTTDFDGLFDRAWAVAVQSDNSLVVVGESIDPLGASSRFAVARYLSTGLPDASFGGNGQVTTDVGAGFMGARDVAIQSNGKIVVVGQGDGQGQQRDFAIVRYNPDGSLDDGGPDDATPGNSFGTDGVVYTDFFSGPIGTSDTAFAVGIDEQNRIVVAGQGGLSQDVAVARYLPDGTLDASFDGDGLATVSLGFGADFGFALGFHPDDGDFFVSASSATSTGEYAQSVFRFHADGSHPFNWGDGGTSGINTSRSPMPSQAHGMVVDNLGRVIVSGTKGVGENRAGFLGRIDSNGDVDTQFNGVGALDISLLGRAVTVNDVVLQADGSYLVAGTALSVSGQQFLLAKVTADGSLDTSYGIDGFVLADFDGSDEAFGLTLDSSGNVIVVGAGATPSSSDFVIARFTGEASGPADTDGDGVPDSVEDSVDIGPTLGDGNGDGTADRGQANVASLPNAGDGEYVTFVSSVGTSLAKVAAVNLGSPNGVALPLGTFSFAVLVPNPGDAANVTMYLPPGSETPNGYFKLGPSLDDPVDHWYQSSYPAGDGLEAIAIDINSDGQDEWQLNLVDGGRGDDDLQANGVIVDPGAPGNAAGFGIVRGIAFHDLDGDGRLGTSVGGEPNEPRMAGATVTIQSNDFGFVQFTTTGADGSYTFTNLPVGSFTVRLAPPPGFIGSVAFTRRSVTVGTPQGLFGQLDPQRSVTLGDLDGDADLDIVAVNFDEVTTLTNQGGGTFEPPRPLGASGETAALGFMTQGAVPDVAIAEDSLDRIRVVPNQTASPNGPIEFGLHVDVNVGDEPWAIATANLDLAGFDDILVANRADGTITPIINGSTFEIRAAIPVGNGPRDIVVGDFNNDNEVDVAVAIEDGVKILMGSIANTLLDGPVVAVPNASHVAAGRFDADDFVDLAVTLNEFNAVAILTSNGNGTFTKTYQVPLGGTDPRGITSADLDGDGDLDLATANSGSNDFSVLLNLGDGQFHLLGEVPPAASDPGQPFRLTAGDINRDGIDDLVTSTLGSGVSSLLLSEPAQARRVRVGTDSFVDDVHLGVRAMDGGAISGTVFRDDDGNGVWNDLTEPGLNLATVFVDLNNDLQLDVMTESWTLTDADGNFRITNLAPGSYPLRAIGPGFSAAYVQTNVHFSNLLPHQVLTGQNLGLRPPGRIEGAVFADLNNDGGRDSNEPGLEGWDVFIDTNGNRQLDTGEPRLQTNADGVFSFVLQAGTYDVVQVVPEGWAQRSPNPAFDAAHSGVVVNTGETTEIEFVNRGAARISGTVWQDQDADGRIGVDEGALANWFVFADQNQNGVRDADEPTSLTSESGNYLLHVTPGTHDVVLELRSGFDATAPASATHVVTPPGGAALAIGVDFGARNTSMDISGVVWNDRDGDGRRGSLEKGHAGAMLYLDENQNDQLDSGEPTAMTNADGEYVFQDVTSDPHPVTLIHREPFIQTFPHERARFGMDMPLSGGVEDVIIANDLIIVDSLNPLQDDYADIVYVESIGENLEIRYGQQGGDFSVPPTHLDSITFTGGLVDNSIAAFQMNPGNGPGQDNFVDLVYFKRYWDGLRYGGIGVDIYLSNGNGTFQEPKSIMVPAAPYSPRLAQLNPSVDMLPDLVLFDNGPVTDELGQLVHPGGGLTVALGTLAADGTPEFGPLISTISIEGPAPFFDSPGSFGLGDFDGDGNLDLVAEHSSSNHLTILPGNGDGTFASHQQRILDQDGSRRDLAIADFDGDGDDDIVLIGQDDETPAVAYLESVEGFGLSQRVVSLPLLPVAEKRSSHVFPADFDGDGRLDIAVIIIRENGNSPIFEPLLLRNIGEVAGAFPADARIGNVNFVTVTSPNLCHLTETILLGDLDGDGSSEFICGTNSLESSGFHYYSFERFSPRIHLARQGGVADFGVLELLDADNDGISDLTESAAPNHGDGNNDGVPDSEQANVTSLRNLADGSYVTLASSEGTTLVDVQAIPNPSFGDVPPGAEFPIGFFAFTIEADTPGAFGPNGAVDVEMVLHSPLEINTYYKYGPTTGDPSDHWYHFLHVPMLCALFPSLCTGAEFIDENNDGSIERILMHFIDGSQGDSELATDGRIVDPGSPGVFHLPGDANRDGSVDGSDFNIWNDNKFEAGDKTWSQGDFNGDGVADGGDFNIWNENKFTQLVAAALAPNVTGHPRTPRAPLASELDSPRQTALAVDEFFSRRDLSAYRLDTHESRTAQVNAESNDSSLSCRENSESWFNHVDSRYDLGRVDRVFSIMSSRERMRRQMASMLERNKMQNGFVQDELNILVCDDQIWY